MHENTTGSNTASSIESVQETGSVTSWTFLTNHSHVLACLAEDPDVRLRDVAIRVGITERAVQRIVTDLEDASILTRHRDGRRNHYEIHGDTTLRHPIEGHRTVCDLLQLLRR